MDTPIPKGNTTPSSQAADREPPYYNLISSHPTPHVFQGVANAPYVAAPFLSALNPPIKTSLSVQRCLPSHCRCCPEYCHTVPSKTTPTSALPVSIPTLQDSLAPSISASRFSGTEPPVPTPPSETFISQYFQARFPNDPARVRNLVRATQGWVIKGGFPYLADDTVFNICIAHCAELRERVSTLPLSSGKGRRTAALETIANDLSLKSKTVRECCGKGVRFLALVRSDGPGSLLLLGRCLRTLWEKELLREDIPPLLEFRTRHMPDFDVQARKLDKDATAKFEKHFVAHGLNRILPEGFLANLLANKLAEDGETPPTAVPIHPAAKLSPDGRKKRMGTHLQDRPSKRSAFHEPSDEPGLASLSEASGQKEIENTVEDLVGRPAGELDSTMLMENSDPEGQSMWMEGLPPPSMEQVAITTWMEDSHLESESMWRQDLLPPPMEPVAITTWMENSHLESQSMWRQDLFPPPMEQLDITTWMEDSHLEREFRWMQKLFRPSAEEPGMNTPTKPLEQDACLPLSSPVQVMQQVQTVDEPEVLQTLEPPNGGRAQLPGRDAAYGSRHM